MSIKLKAILAALTISLLGSMPAYAELRVGAARIDQTGALGETQPGTYAHERIYARAIVMENDGNTAALVSYEGPYGGLDMLSTRQAMAEALDTSLANIVVTHTHSHSREVVHNQEREMPEDGVSPELLEAVIQARDNMQPALASYDTGISFLNVNRDAIDPESRKWVQGINMDGVVDRSVGVLSFIDHDGAPIAVWVNYAIHPVSGYMLGIISGDIPGAMSRYIEQSFGDTMVAAFSQGTSGDINSLYLRPSNIAMASRFGEPLTGYLMDRETFEAPLREAARNGEDIPPVDPQSLDKLLRFLESQGQVLGEEVIRVMSKPQDWQDDVRIAGFTKNFNCPGRIRTNGNTVDASREGVAGEYADSEDQTLRTSLIGIGNISIFTINGEAFAAIGKKIKEEALMNNTMIVTVANERMRGYIPDDASFGHQTFQVLNNRIKPGCAEPGLVDAVVELQKAYLGNN
ncbi:MAG: hypothetical protein RLN82_05015 [Pseudomonadales bacterium]